LYEKSLRLPREKANALESTGSVIHITGSGQVRNDPHQGTTSQAAEETMALYQGTASAVP
jgi:hypothetical protein